MITIINIYYHEKLQDDDKNLKILATFFPEGFRPIVLAPCLLLQVATSKEVRDIGCKYTTEDLYIYKFLQKK